MTPKSELAWKLADYQRNNIEPPDRLIANPAVCEGELMTPVEVTEFINDSVGTLLVLLDRGSERFLKVRENFKADLDFLLELGKIAEDEYNEITASEEFNI
jgi:hypothetical protein